VIEAITSDRFQTSPPRHRRVLTIRGDDFRATSSPARRKLGAPSTIRRVAAANARRFGIFSLTIWPKQHLPMLRSWVAAVDLRLPPTCSMPRFGPGSYSYSAAVSVLDV